MLKKESTGLSTELSTGRIVIFALIDALLKRSETIRMRTDFGSFEQILRGAENSPEITPRGTEKIHQNRHFFDPFLHFFDLVPYVL